MGVLDNKDEGRKEYSINWIKGCLYRYLQGKGDVDKIRGEIQRAKSYGISKHNFQVIIDSLPFDRKLERFQDILKILREDPEI